MKHWWLCGVLFLLFHLQGHTQERSFRWGWTLFDIGLSYDFLNVSSSIDYNFLKIEAVFFDRLNLITGAMSIKQYRTDDIVSHSFLPVEIGFIPWKHNIFYWSLFGRGEWVFTQTAHPFLTGEFTPRDNKFCGVFGTRLFFLFESGLNYNFYSSLYVEYSTQNELRIGISLDLTFAAAFAGIAIFSYAESKSEEFEKEYRKEHPFPWE
ncbi:MAG: hypothetical protein LBE02_05175 [Spirochaetaceae bacterium]|jgi:hypothetical protein|nr:hypothetical protein [Spirochaetaceae bacterium]